MIPLELAAWAHRHGIAAAALADLSATLGVVPAPPAGAGSEANVQSLVRLAAPARGMRLWRNNVGTLRDERGVPVRYGLANDSPALNKRLKSSDLIGWRRLEIGGHVVAQFVALECKRPGWRFTPGDDRDEAQARWVALVAADGGYAKFVTDAGQL